MRRLCLGLAIALFLSGGLAFATGWLTSLDTHGNSMAPRIETGDLVLVARTSSYGVGEVVAYASSDLDQVVLHRIVAIEDDRYTLRGDHNDFNDPEQPVADQILGEEILFVPHGKLWVDRLTSPPALAALAFVALSAGGAAARGRRRRKKKPMAQHAAAPRRFAQPRRFAPHLRTAAAIAAATALTGLSLGVYSVVAPVTGSARAPDVPESQMTFSYQASVPRSPAYDDTTVSAPDPLFRTLVDQVRLTFDYQGEPGSISVAAELSSPSGWHAEVPLQSPIAFEGSQYSGAVDLDLDSLEARASAAGEIIGIPVAQVQVAIVAHVEAVSGQRFTPQVAFALTPAAFQLAGDVSSLTVKDDTATPHQVGPHGIHLAGRHVSVSSLRVAAAVLALGGLIALAAIILRTRSGAGDSPTAIRRQYAALLLHVEPVTSPATRPVVDVVDFPTLARLAERYGLLIMHWTRSDIETFIVQDDGITYRYRIAVPLGASDDDRDTADRQRRLAQPNSSGSAGEVPMSRTAPPLSRSADHEPPWETSR